jgi:hypothetical protein
MATGFLMVTTQIPCMQVVNSRIPKLILGDSRVSLGYHVSIIHRRKLIVKNEFSQDLERARVPEVLGA